MRVAIDPKTLPIRRKLMILSGALLGLFMAALDQTIVGTALPKILAELGGIDQYTWVVTIYLLTSTVFVPIFGKLSDIYGRKPLITAGMLIFVLGSVLAGAAQDIGQLIAFRAIQGIGAAALMGNTFTVVADLFAPSERGKWMGLVGAVFGMSSVVGPLLGGFITDNFDWRWNFYVNVPVGAIGLAILAATMPRVEKRGDASVDYIGSLTLAAALGSILMALTWGGVTYDWASVQVLGMFAIFAVSLVAFIFAELRAKDPIVPLDIFKEPIVSVSMIIVFLTGIGMFAAIVYIPLFAQVVQGKTATNSGIIILPLVMAMVTGAISTGQLISRLGRYRLFALIGCSVMAVGMLLLSRIHVGTSDIEFMSYMVITGLGLGMLMPTFNLAVQNTVPHERLGVATALVQLCRGLGAILGLAVLGNIFNNGLPGKIDAALSPWVVSQVPAPVEKAFDALKNPQALASVESAQRAIERIPGQYAPLVSKYIEAAKEGLAQIIALDFLVAAVFILMALVAAFALKEVPLRTADHKEPASGPPLAADEVPG